ncbi:flagellar biosynthesis repressor FlbT [Palleronia sediminis]|uniref:Flagellar biosynthesis repressor FlbT n=1 Tax=Palleronia sediminis TaxID=2547833 RepID=A0A4R6AJD4_9RHOB|nr:flagellar biosynthesis repressor FlbT [Palleronia sediminis]TDL81523.1 flagellar biosynthesis repressor FlbT [Palleronia sediminis]
MAGLVLKLAPHERLLINGAVIQNGARRGSLNIVTPGANILRLRDAVHPGEATTPARRLCYGMQLVLSGDTTLGDAAPELMAGLDDLAAAMCDGDSRRIIAEAKAALIARRTYQALRALRRLLPREDRALGKGA